MCCLKWRIYSVSVFCSAVLLYVLSVYSVWASRIAVKPESVDKELPEMAVYRTEAFTNEVLTNSAVSVSATSLAMIYPTVVTEEVTKKEEEVENEPEFTFPESVSSGAQEYLKEAYKQAYEVSQDTVFPDPFMALALSVIELPLTNYEVFCIPLVSQDTLNTVLASSGGDYAAAIKHSSDARKYQKYACVGPLQIATGWVACTPRNPTVWREACQMFYEDAELAVPGMTKFAEACGIVVDDMLLRTLAAMRHNVGNLSDWANSNPDSSPKRDFIPFKTKRAVFQWNAAVASKTAQDAIKKGAYEAYEKYLQTGRYDAKGLDWRYIADLTGYPQSKVLSGKQSWRPLYVVRFWHNYYQLRLLYGVDTAETLGIEGV